MNIKIQDILDFIGNNFSLIGKINDQTFITSTKPILEASEIDLVWVSQYSENQMELIQQTKSKVIVCSKNLTIENEIENKLLICVENPRLTFSRIINHFYFEEQKFQIHKSVVIHEEAEIDKNVYIGPNSIIGKCKIGKGTVIYGNCTIYDNTIIGDNVKIHAGAVIGTDGFGYDKNENGEYEQFPHIGGVLIENDVEIGANTAIDRGSLGNTIIRKGTKIDNLVHIAHNVEIGKNSVVIACAEVSGSVKIGENSWIGPGAKILDRLTIGKNSLIGIGAVVIKNVDENATVVGNPARRIK